MIPIRRSIPGDCVGDSLPLSWYHQFDGGREYYIALGHNKADYSNPLLYQNQILGEFFGQWRRNRNRDQEHE